MAGQKTKKPAIDYPSPADISITADFQDLLVDYAESTVSLLDELESLALAIEKGDQSTDTADAIRRVLHKVKGESGVMGVEQMSEVFHETERLFDETDTADRTQLLLETRDWACRVVAHLAGPDIPGLQIDTSDIPSAQTAVQQETKTAVASDVMKTAVMTVAKDSPVYDAISLLVSRNITGLPVLSRDLALAGVLSEKDVLKLLYDLQDSDCPVEKFMTPQVVTFSPDTPVEQICDCFLSNDFRRVIIIENNKLAGIVSRRNIITANKEAFEQKYPELRPKRSKIFRAADVMTKGILTVDTDCPVYQVMDIMIKHNVTGLPVVNQDFTLAGIISEKDVLRLSLDLKNAAGSAGDYMTKDVVTFSPEDSLIDICDCLINNHFRRVVVLRNNRVAGIISRRDIISLILSRRACTFARRKSDD